MNERGKTICMTRHSENNVPPSIKNHSISFIVFNPIRSGIFQTANDQGEGGGSLKAPTPTISKTICINLHHIIDVHFNK